MATPGAKDSRPRLPTLYLSHGGGPCFWMSFPPPFGPHGWDRLADYLRGVLASLPARPRAILLVSAHWEMARPTVGAGAAPPMLFDYYGFPEHTYRLNYPAPGSPALAREVQDLLAAAGIASDVDPERGFDHGVFVPMLLINPQADIPVATLSLQESLDPAQHLAIGRALAPLRDQGVLIVGSGSSFHNLATFQDGDSRDSLVFDQWLTEAATLPDAKTRNERLALWSQAPRARACHPREEHLLPLMVAAGAAGEDVGRLAFTDLIGGKRLSGYVFG